MRSHKRLMMDGNNALADSIFADVYSNGNRTDSWFEITDCFWRDIVYDNFIPSEQVTSYVDLSFANMVQNGIIKEVVIGPKSDLYYYMIANGYETDVDIRKSDVSYR